MYRARDSQSKAGVGKRMKEDSRPMLGNSIYPEIVSICHCVHQRECPVLRSLYNLHRREDR